MTLKAYLRILRERWMLILGVLLVCVVAAVTITQLLPRKYTATAQVLVTSAVEETSISAGQASVFLQQQVSTFAAVLVTPPVLHAIQTDLNLHVSDDELRSELSASAPSGQSIILVHVTDASPLQAARIANSAAAAFTAMVEQYMKPNGSRDSPVKLIITDPARPPSTASSPLPKLNIAAGVLIGLLLGIALAVIVELLDTAIKTVEVLSKASGMPGLGIVVEDETAEQHVMATHAGMGNRRAENFRQLRANLQFTSIDSEARVIAITSSIPAEGKTMVAINLAATLESVGFSVCLVDGDLRRPAVASQIGLIGQVGMTNVLIRQLSLEEALQEADGNLKVLASGYLPPNPSEVLASLYFHEIVAQLRASFDYVIIDTPPLLPFADAMEIAATADGVILVARHGVTTESQVKQSALTLRRVNTRLLGVILNRVPPTTGRADLYYDYYAADEKPRVSSRDQGRSDPSDEVSVALSVGGRLSESGRHQRSSGA